MREPLPFPNQQSIPILGQQCTPLACCHTVVIRCNCEAQTILTIQGVDAVGICPACRRVYKIGDLHYQAALGQGTVTIACVGTANPPEAPPDSVSKPS